MNHNEKHIAFEKRLERAIELGWESVQCGEVWVMNDPKNRYSGMGDNEIMSFWDILADDELWDDVERDLYGDDKS